MIDFIVNHDLLFWASLGLVVFIYACGFISVLRAFRGRR